MKYSIDCPRCGDKYVAEMDFTPKFCGKCGFDNPTVEKVLPPMRRTPDYAAIEAEIAEIEVKLQAIDEDTQSRVSTIMKVANEQKKVHKDRLRELKRQMHWKNYGQKTYKPVDHSQDLAVVLFGKRRCDLSPEELRKYNRVCAQRSRERAKKRMLGE